MSLNSLICYLFPPFNHRGDGNIVDMKKYKDKIFAVETCRRCGQIVYFDEDWNDGFYTLKDYEEFYGVKKE